MSRYRRAVLDIRRALDREDTAALEAALGAIQQLDIPPKARERFARAAQGRDVEQLAPLLEDDVADQTISGFRLGTLTQAWVAGGQPQALCLEGRHIFENLVDFGGTIVNGCQF